LPRRPVAGERKPLSSRTWGTTVWDGKTISVVFATYKKKDSIADTIRAFDKLGVVGACRG